MNRRKQTPIRFLALVMAIATITNHYSELTKGASK